MALISSSPFLPARRMASKGIGLDVFPGSLHSGNWCVNSPKSASERFRCLASRSIRYSSLIKSHIIDLAATLGDEPPCRLHRFSLVEFEFDGSHVACSALAQGQTSLSQSAALASNLKSGRRQGNQGTESFTQPLLLLPTPAWDLAPRCATTSAQPRSATACLVPNGARCAR